MKKAFTICAFTENVIGLTHRITIIFTRRKINIVSMTTSESEIKGVYRFTFVVKTTQEQVEKIVKQVEKQVGVYKAFFYEDGNMIYREVALYKMPKEFATPENISTYIHAYGARIIDQEDEFIVIEKTGFEKDTQVLFDLLKPHNILGFVRSGRVALARSMPQLRKYLEELSEDTHHIGVAEPVEG